MSGPRITVSSPEAEGITLYSSGHPEFETAFQTPRAKGYDPILPYSVVIQNKTAHEIVAYSVVWHCKGHDGIIRNPVRSMFDFASNNPSRLAPQSKHIVSLLLKLESGGATWDRSDEEASAHLLELLSTQSEIEISLDAVRFIDGISVGPDTAGWIPRWRGWLAAEMEVFARTSEAPFSEVPQLLQGFRDSASALAQRPAICSGEEFELLGAMADRAETYEECRTLASGYLAGSIQSGLDRGDFPTIESIRSMIRGTHFPAL